MQYEEIDLGSLDPIEIPVKIGGEDYVLCEAMESQTIAYRDAMMSRMEMSRDGKQTKFKSIAGVDAYLVSMCLYHIGDGTRGSVSVEKIKSWPSRIVKPLYRKIKEISELDEPDDDDEADEKNSEFANEQNDT